MDFFTFMNPIFWVFSNLLILYIGLVLLVFVGGYWYLFDPKATTGGKFIFRFTLSLLFLIALVFIGVWLDPRQGAAWFQYPGDILPWRPLARFAAYSFVAYTITSLAVLLAIRKWWPHLLKTAKDKDLVVPRKTGPIPTIFKEQDDDTSTTS